MGIDPVTHKPRADADTAGGGSGARSRVAAHLSHTAQWESARLEAEARLARDAKLRALASPPPPASSVLDSPTSTLSFSETAMFAAAANDVHGVAPVSVQHLQSYGQAACGEDQFGAGTFDSALLDCSLADAHQRLVVAVPEAVGGDQSEEDKGYWSSILNMVNSSVSPSLTSEVVQQHPVMMYLPPATEEF
jgi:myb proto-oncogene protein